MFYKLISKHKREKLLGANLSENLRNQHNKRSMRVIKGDTVRILRGEYVGIEGKVEKVNTERSTLSIEGVQREKYVVAKSRCRFMLQMFRLFQ